MTVDIVPWKQIIDDIARSLRQMFLNNSAALDPPEPKVIFTGTFSDELQYWGNTSIKQASIGPLMPAHIDKQLLGNDMLLTVTIDSEVLSPIARTYGYSNETVVLTCTANTLTRTSGQSDVVIEFMESSGLRFQVWTPRIRLDSVQVDIRSARMEK